MTNNNTSLEKCQHEFKISDDEIRIRCVKCSQSWEMVWPA